MYKKANILEIDNVIDSINTGRVAVRNVNGAQVYDVYSLKPKYKKVPKYTRKPTVSFANNWGEESYVLYLDGEQADAFSYRNSSKFTPECQKLVGVMTACIKRCRTQDETVLSGNGVSISCNGGNIIERRKSAFAKFLDKMRASRIK